MYQFDVLHFPDLAAYRAGNQPAGDRMQGFLVTTDSFPILAGTVASISDAVDTFTTFLCAGTVVTQKSVWNWS